MLQSDKIYRRADDTCRLHALNRRVYEELSKSLRREYGEYKMIVRLDSPGYTVYAGRPAAYN